MFERNINQMPPPNGDLALNPGMCPDWELNWHPFCLQASAQFTEPCQLGLLVLDLDVKIIYVDPIKKYESHFRIWIKGDFECGTDFKLLH